MTAPNESQAVAENALTSEIESLGPWFHNIHLPDGTQTAPDHWLGDFPRFKWREIMRHVPEDLTGWEVLDIGCNGGFYSFELAKRGAQVRAIDVDERYLRQARWAAQRLGLEKKIQFEPMQVYDLARDSQTYDLVWFMGVFYHLRYPLLGLEIVARKTRRQLVFQTLTAPGQQQAQIDENLPLDERHQLNQAGWPKMAFIEHRMANDPTNWWAPNHACVEALIRSCSLQVTARPTDETYLCVPASSDRNVMHDEEYCSAVGLASRHSHSPRRID